MAYAPRSTPRIALGFLGLSFTQAGCGDSAIADDGCADDLCQDDGYTEYGPYTDDGYSPEECGEFGCYTDDGYYPPTTTTFDDDGPFPDTGYETFDDEGYYPTTDYTDTGYTGTDTFETDTLGTDTLGTWSLQWNPDGSTGDSVITIDANGEFIWRETSADCSVDTLATGFLWVEPGQLVMHVETWERQLPWDTMDALGQEFPAPFRLRMTYALLGPNLGLAGPSKLTSEPYTGRAQLQESSKGVYIAGKWIGEAELWAIPAGEQLAEVIVRDSIISDLDIEPGVTPESTGITTLNQVYWAADPPVGGNIFESGAWTCLDGCPQPAGATLINGGNLYAYGPYAAYQRLMVFASGRSFRRDVDTDCP